MTLRVAFIGTGRMARQHWQALAQTGVAARVVGVHDRLPDRAEQFAALAGTRTYPTPAILLASARPDVVHVCTPPSEHFDAARAALEGGAHVYVEKPFALTSRDAIALTDLARARGRLVCAGHQLLWDRAFEILVRRLPELGSLTQVDSHFAFRPGGFSTTRGNRWALAEQLIDILPHPLYSLIAIMERAAGQRPIELAWAHADPEDLQAIVRAGPLVGRLSVSLRSRPVASSLALTGTNGSLTCDFVHSALVGAANPGTETLEKILNPLADGMQTITRSAASLLRRLRTNTGYPGLSELIAAFYRAVAAGSASPIPPEHLLHVTRLFETLAAGICEAADRQRAARPSGQPAGTGPLMVVTGAGGFLGSAISRALNRVRGIGRGTRPDDPCLHDWVTADLSHGLAADAVADADVVVHAAAETSGGYDDHQRNTIDATRHLLRAMRAADTRRLLLISSLSVLKPPSTPWERQDEHTPRPRHPRRLGPYTWGKCRQEELVDAEAARFGIETRTIRPGALVDWQEPALPGLMGRRLLGRWHIAFGRPGLPIAVCDVRDCAKAIAWCATHFEEAPRVVNLIDSSITTRGELLERLRACGWQGRIVWVPITVMAGALFVARFGASLCRGRLPASLAVWSILRPRRYNVQLAAKVFDAARREADVLDQEDVAMCPCREISA